MLSYLIFFFIVFLWYCFCRNQVEEEEDIPEIDFNPEELTNIRPRMRRRAGSD